LVPEGALAAGVINGVASGLESIISAVRDAADKDESVDWSNVAVNALFAANNGFISGLIGESGAGGILGKD